MTTPHVSHELLALVLKGELPPRTLVHLVRDHLTEVCSHCAEALESLQQSRAQGRAAEERQATAHPSTGGQAIYGQALHRAAGRALSHADDLHGEKEAALTDLRELRSLPAAEATARVDRAYSRFRSPHLASLLLAECRRRVESEAEEAGRFARLALDVLERVPVEHRDFWVDSLGIRAHAAVANARRAAGDLEGANAGFRRLRARLARDPSDDPEVHAEVSSLEAALRRVERRFADAEGLLARAVLCYRQAGRQDGVAQALIQKGVVHRLVENPTEALDCFTEAMDTAGDKAGPEGHPELFLCAVTYRALCLCDLDRYAEAEELVASHRRLFARSRGPWSRTRRLWLEGRIHQGSQRPVEAEGCLEEARDAFLAEEDDFYAALVSLDLAVLYLEQRRWPELRAVAGAMSTALQPGLLRQHEIAALILFQRSVAAEQVTAAAVRRLQGNLEHLREDLRFVAPA